MGIGFIVLVSVIWAASSVLIQHIYTDTHNTFHSPFLVTYIGISLFTLWLPTQRIVKCLQQQQQQQHWCCCTTTNEYETIPLENGNDDFGLNHVDAIEVTSSSTTDSTIQDTEESNTNDRNNVTVRYNNHSPMDDYLQVPEDSMAAWTEYDHFYTAMYIAPVWFIANWSYNTSLIYTTITSSTVLASTGSLFTYMFAIATHDEQINTLKFVGICLGVLGSFITTLSDTTTSTAPSQSNIAASIATSNDDFSYNDPVSDTTNQSSSSSTTTILPMLGDLLGVISAIGYGAYAVQTRIYCPKNESLYSMQILLGYIGLCNLIVLSPFAIYLLLSGQSQLTWIIVGFLVLKGLFDNVLSDYLWLRAVILTNATTATVGLGLTIPLAFASDILLGKQGVLRMEQILGAITVLVGFVLVNIGNNEVETASVVTRTTNTDPIDSSERSDAGHFNDRPPMDVDDNKSQRGQEIVSLPNLHLIS